MVAGPSLDEAMDIVEFLATLPTYEGRKVSAADLRSLWLLQADEPGKVEAHLDGSLLYVSRQCSGQNCTHEVTGSALVDY